MKGEEVVRARERIPIRLLFGERPAGAMEGVLLEATIALGLRGESMGRLWIVRVRVGEDGGAATGADLDVLLAVLR